MDELVVNGALYPEASEKICETLNMLKFYTDKRDEIMKVLLNAMEQNHLKSIENDQMVITFVDEYERETFDSKKFRKWCEENDSELYNDNVKFTTIKPSVRIKLK